MSTGTSHPPETLPTPAKAPAPPLSGPSLRLRLCFFFSALVLATWVCGAVMSWYACRKYTDEFFDTHLLLFAKLLTLVDVQELGDTLPDTAELLQNRQIFSTIPPELLPDTDSTMFAGNYDAEALGFAIFDRSGMVQLSDGQNGSNFIFRPDSSGFTDSSIIGSKEQWRLVCLPSANGKHLVCVGQHLGYRRGIALALLARQLYPWAAMVFVLIAGLVLIVNHELAPLQHLRRRLAARKPENVSPLGGPPVPREIVPLVMALDRLFLKMGNTLVRERAFTANAAHELQTPLAALRVQAEVALAANDDEAVREKALNNLVAGIDTSSHLVGQLLTLSRLDALDETRDQQEKTRGADSAPEHRAAPPAGQEAHAGKEDDPDDESLLHWPLLLEEAMDSHRPQAEKKNLALSLEITGSPAPRQGDNELCALLLRNLFDNAVRYAPPGGTIEATLTPHGLTLENTCPATPMPDVSRLGERFFRPRGQHTRGSGLGLSIARQVAALHGYSLLFSLAPNDPAPEGGEQQKPRFQARLVWNQELERE